MLSQAEQIFGNKLQYEIDRPSSNRNGQKNRKIGIRAPKKQEKNRNSPLEIGEK